MDFKKLVKQQKKAQKSKNRSKNINFYDHILSTTSLLKQPITDYLTDQINDQNQVSWADLGAGNQIALREAKFLLGSDINTYSIDLLDMDSNKKIVNSLDLYKHHNWTINPFNDQSNEHVIDVLMSPHYAPKHYNDDATKIKLEQKVDLITAVWVFPYIENPLDAFQNNIDNLKDEGKFLFNLSEQNLNKNKNFMNKLYDLYGDSISHNESNSVCMYKKR